MQFFLLCWPSQSLSAESKYYLRSETSTYIINFKFVKMYHELSYLSSSLSIMFRQTNKCILIDDDLYIALRNYNSITIKIWKYPRDTLNPQHYKNQQSSCCSFLYTDCIQCIKCNRIVTAKLCEQSRSQMQILPYFLKIHNYFPVLAFKMLK